MDPATAGHMHAECTAAAASLLLADTGGKRRIPASTQLLSLLHVRGVCTHMPVLLYWLPTHITADTNWPQRSVVSVAVCLCLMLSFT